MSVRGGEKEGLLKGRMPSKQPIENKCGSLLRNWRKRWGFKMYCIQSPLRGRKRCKFHNGAATRGLQHHSVTHGKYITVWPDKGLGKSFEEVFESRELRQQRRDIATLEVRIVELRRKLKSEDTLSMNLERAYGRSSPVFSVSYIC